MTDAPGQIPSRRYGITLGDPAGIGPEIVVKALAALAPAERERIVLIGDSAALQRADEAFGCGLVATCALEPAGSSGNPVPGGIPSAAGGAASYAAVVRAVELARSGAIDVIVTAPLSKEALHLAGRRYDGHTGLLAHLCGVPNPFMLLAAPAFSVIHVSAHVPLRVAIDRVRTDRVLDAIRTGARHLQRLGIPRPKIRVAGLNPHAGESGILGTEDDDEIAPAVEQARAEGLDVSGPHPPDTVFRLAAAGDGDLVVAQYHDQGHIPVKLSAFDTAVNVTLGLPILRVSVDHGTAFDIAWKGVAKPDNLHAALAYARRLVDASAAS